MYAGKGIGEIMHWLDNKLKRVKESLYEYIINYSDEDYIENYIE